MVFRKLGRQLGLGGKDKDEPKPEPAAPARQEPPIVTQIAPPPVEATPASDPAMTEPQAADAPADPDTTQPDAGAEVPVAEPKAPAVEAAELAPPSHRTYTVESGDSLSAIAQRFYGDANAYMKIFEANRDKLANPDLIQPGQELVIPD